MALLSASNLSKSFGTDLLFEGVSFEVQTGDKIGVVGVNGSGKTTLFKMLTGEMRPDGGEVYQSKNAVVGYMEQHVCKNLEESALDEVLTVFHELTLMEEELETLSVRIQKGMGNLQEMIERQALLNDRFVAEGGLTYKSRARSALLGLGFSDGDMALRVGALSGGQKAKLQLAKMLLCGANFMLLDEPTNHLDISSVEWLEDYLRAFNGSFLVISHDRYFLDKITTRTFEMENHRLTVYKGGYTAYLRQKEEDTLAARRVYDNTRREIARLEGVVAQQRQWNREKNIKTAESKLKAIGRLEQGLEKPDSAPEAIRFHFEIKQPGGNDVLEVSDLSLSFGGAPLFQNVELNLKRGERVFLLGPNGCGKTSLFKTLLNQYQPDTGHIRLGAGIDFGYYDQIQSGLDTEKTVMDEIWDQYPRMTQTEVRNALAVFLFKGDSVFKPVSALSGGEKARVLLLKLMLSRANFLLLDEPTNHLDISSREALEGALSDYEGTLFIISHDRYLINKIADRVYYLEPAGVLEYTGNYDDFLEKRLMAAAPEKEEKTPRQNDYKLRKERESELRKLKTQIKKAESHVDELDAQMGALAERLSAPETASDYALVLELTEKIAGLKDEQEQALAAWEALCSRLERAE